MKKNMVGTNAGIIWELLSKTGENSIADIVESTGLKKDEVNMALGWLLKEEKITFIKVGRTEKVILI